MSNHNHNPEYRFLIHMVRGVIAFCPGHISGYFKRVIGRDAATTGSIGAGIVISEGVLVRVKLSNHMSVRICRNERSAALTVVAHESPPLAYAMNRLSIKASVTTECRLPIGAGFGLSAAALLATLTALDTLFELGMSEEDIAHAAHEAEIVHHTGLGDVAACRGGGFVVRTHAGIKAPFHRYLSLPGPIYAVSFGPIHTPSVLEADERMEQVASAFPDTEPENIQEFFRYSRTFAERSGLLTPQIRAVLDRCDELNIPASMTMLGNGVFAYGKEAERVLSRFGLTYAMGVAVNGPHVVEVIP
jgi:pantoate kinase